VASRASGRALASSGHRLILPRRLSKSVSQDRQAVVLVCTRNSG
jgi:hypothetical protein